MATSVPDERLRLIFTCCHPALAPEAQVALTLSLLAHQAYLMCDAVARTLYRKLVSKRRLLEWTTAAQAEAQAERDRYAKSQPEVHRQAPVRWLGLGPTRAAIFVVRIHVPVHSRDRCRGHLAGRPG